ncbi:MAG TPA: hypothetical protein VNE67_09150 [Acetobacteraceae bacterium]|nr:hypothetical protein [Acetobacteraceae bacterium]
MPESWKPGTGQRIERLYAWIATEADGGEGICGALFGLLQMPLIGADRERVESFRGYAEMIARERGCPVHLVEFRERVDHEPLALGQPTETRR